MIHVSRFIRSKHFWKTEFPKNFDQVFRESILHLRVFMLYLQKNRKILNKLSEECSTGIMFWGYLGHLFAYTLFSHQNINFKKYQYDF